MKKHILLKKGFTIAIIVLFIGVVSTSLTGGVVIEKPSMPTFNDPTIVSIQPQSQTVEPGESFYVSVYIEPGEPIMGAYFDVLYYDPNLIHAYQINFNGFFDPYVDPLFDPGIIDNINGEIRNVYEILVGPGSVSDPGSWVTIYFDAQQQSGTSYLDLGGVIISNETGYTIPIEVYDGIVNIPIDEDVNVDHKVHFMDLVAVSRRYNDEGPNGWIREDVNNDGVVHFMDLVAVSMHYNEEW